MAAVRSVVHSSKTNLSKLSTQMVTFAMDGQSPRNSSPHNALPRHRRHSSIQPHLTTPKARPRQSDGDFWAGLAQVVKVCGLSSPRTETTGRRQSIEFALATKNKQTVNESMDTVKTILSGGKCLQALRMLRQRHRAVLVITRCMRRALERRRVFIEQGMLLWNAVEQESIERRRQLLEGIEARSKDLIKADVNQSGRRGARSARLQGLKEIRNWNDVEECPESVKRQVLSNLWREKTRKIIVPVTRRSAKARRKGEVRVPMMPQSPRQRRIAALAPGAIERALNMEGVPQSVRSAVEAVLLAEGKMETGRSSVSVPTNSLEAKAAEQALRDAVYGPYAQQWDEDTRRVLESVCWDTSNVRPGGRMQRTQRILPPLLSKKEVEALALTDWAAREKLRSAQEEEKNRLLEHIGAAQHFRLIAERQLSGAVMDVDQSFLDRSKLFTSSHQPSEKTSVRPITPQQPKPLLGRLPPNRSESSVTTVRTQPSPRVPAPLPQIVRPPVDIPLVNRPPPREPINRSPPRQHINRTPARFLPDPCQTPAREPVLRPSPAQRTRMHPLPPMPTKECSLGVTRRVVTLPARRRVISQLRRNSFSTLPL